ncbi:MAG: lipopolysaccharide export system permease protein [Rhodothermales bacterium]|jgi:lipopolysaccharide export system permease protein
MRILNSYISKNIFTYLFVAIAVGTFIMFVGQFARVFDLLAKGVPLGTLLKLVSYRLPQVLGFTIPLGLFVSALLVFNRMSSEHEISALRASGISMLQVSAPVLFLGIVLSALCVWMQFATIPTYTGKAKWLVRAESVKNPLMLISENQFIELFDGYIIYVGRKSGNEVRDIHIYSLSDEGVIQRKIDANKGEIRVDDDAKVIHLMLYNATIDTVDPEAPHDPLRSRRLKAGDCEFPLSYGERLHARSLTQRVAQMQTKELFARVQIYSERGQDPTPLFVEINLRAAMGLTPFSLLLLALPLGIRVTRQDNTRALFVGILVPLLYFTLISLFESLNETPSAHPAMLMWVPNLLCQGLGIWGLWSKR